MHLYHIKKGLCLDNQSFRIKLGTSGSASLKNWKNGPSQQWKKKDSGKLNMPMLYKFLLPVFSSYMAQNKNKMHWSALECNVDGSEERPEESGCWD